MEVNLSEVWPFNLLCRIFDEEEIQILKMNAPKELEAFLIYTVRDTYSNRDADIILKYFMEQIPSEEIARELRLKKDRIDEVIKIAGRKLRDPELKDTYRKGLQWRVTREKQDAYIAGYQKGYAHAIKGVASKEGDLVDAFSEVCFDLPGHNHPIAFLDPSEELYNAMYFAGIEVIGQLLEADDRKLLTEYRLDRSEIDEIAELMKKKGYCCNITRARNNIRIAYWPERLLVAGLSETAAHHLMCYAPVDLKETFEFVRKIALNRKDEEILKFYYDLDFSYKEISDKLQISIYKAHERMINALRKLRDPKYFDLIRYGLKATVREMIRLESECGFQDGFNRGIEERWEDINEETGEMNVPESLHNCMNGITIEDLQLSVRVSKCLRRNKVETLVDLLQMQDKDLLAINNLGKSALKDIRRKQNEYIKNLLVEMVADEVVVLRTREEDFQTQGGIR